MAKTVKEMREAAGGFRTFRLSVQMLLMWAMTAGSVPAAPPPRSGEAVVAATVGKVQARVFTGPVHDGQTELIDLDTGSSVGEATRVMTGRNGRICMALSPGAVLCVAPDTEITFRQLRHSAEGLPKSEDDLVRRIYIDVNRGRILVHAGTPTPTLDIRIYVDAGEVKASGGTFAVAQTGKGEWAVINEQGGNTVLPAKADRVDVPEGDSFKLTLADNGVAAAKEDKTLLDSPLRKFEICNCFFDDLETFIQDPAGFDRAGLSRYIGETTGIGFVGSEDNVMDVSPLSQVAVKRTSFIRSMPGHPGTRTRWNSERAWAWYDNLGVVKGVNYIPRNAVNSTEMWMEKTFDPDVIDEELGWARKAGYTTLRVQLQYVVWKADPDGFIKRVHKFVDLAEKHDLHVVPVLFDDRNFAGRDPSASPQPEPIPGEHNAQWTPSPGLVAVTDRSVWPDLEKYVRKVIGEFKRDDRVVYWDLYNRTGDSALWEQSLPLMEQAFNWARDVDPKQPLAVAAWTRPESAMSTRMLERSDIITFQSFESESQVEALLMLLKRYDRPIICSDWLMRQRENNFEKMLPLFSVNRVGWFNRGLVKGKTQEWIQQEQYRSETKPDLWQHDVLTPDGEAYKPKEVELIQQFRFMDRS